MFPHAAARILSCGKNFKSTSFVANTSIHSTMAKLTKIMKLKISTQASKIVDFFKNNNAMITNAVI